MKPETVASEQQENKDKDPEEKGKDSEETSTPSEPVIVSKEDVTSPSETTKEASVAPTSGESETLKEERHEDPMDTSEEKSKTVEDATVPKEVCVWRLNFLQTLKHSSEMLFLKHCRYLDCQRGTKYSKMLTGAIFEFCFPIWAT